MSLLFPKSPDKLNIVDHGNLFLIYYGAIALKRITRAIPDVFIKRESVSLRL